MNLRVTGIRKVYFGTFRQPAGEFIVNYNPGCGEGGCRMDATCFSKRLGKFLVGFLPSEINKEHPVISTALGDNFDWEKSSFKKDRICLRVIEHLIEKTE